MNEGAAAQRAGTLGPRGPLHPGTGLPSLLILLVCRMSGEESGRGLRISRFSEWDEDVGFVSVSRATGIAAVLTLTALLLDRAFRGPKIKSGGRNTVVNSFLSCSRSCVFPYRGSKAERAS